MVVGTAGGETGELLLILLDGGSWGGCAGNGDGSAGEGARCGGGSLGLGGEGLVCAGGKGGGAVALLLRVVVLGAEGGGPLDSTPPKFFARALTAPPPLGDGVGGPDLVAVGVGGLTLGRGRGGKSGPGDADMLVRLLSFFT